MSRINTPLALAAIAGLALTGCTNPDGSTNNTGTGVLLGGVLGATTGAIIDDGQKEGAIIGGLIGAGVGGVIGNQLDKQQAELEQEIGGSGARIINTGDRLIVVMPEAITFDVDSATVRNSIRDELYAISRSLQNYPNTTVQVIGHTDNTGSTSYNQGLSERRANSVASILIQGGTSSSRIVAYGRGETQPVATNATPQGRQQNRRVEIVITPTG